MKLTITKEDLVEARKHVLPTECNICACVIAEAARRSFNQMCSVGMGTLRTSESDKVYFIKTEDDALMSEIITLFDAGKDEEVAALLPAELSFEKASYDY